MVYVQDIHGKALMPTERYGKVRRMLQDGRAVVVRRTPFTIRLLYDTTHFVQDVTLGVDAGTTHIGLSATTDTKELFSAEVTLRTDIVNLLSTRREVRRTRRNYKTRYRKPRFDNRRRKEGWLAPSVEQKVQSHLNVIAKVNDILPISKTVIEVAQFDTQLLKNPDIQGAEYQKGPQADFWNTREYVLWRDGHKCRNCGGKSRDKILEIHHLESRKTGGNSPDNLVTLCKSCHDAYHKGSIELKLKRTGTSLRDAAAMGIMRWELYNRAKLLWSNVHLIYGYITKSVRIENRLEKSHVIDARCISEHPLVKPCGETLLVRQTRRHNRQIHKANLLSGGRKKPNQAPYLVKGFRLFDKVFFGGTECFIFGRRSSGSFDIRLIDGTKVKANINCKKLSFIECSKSYLTTLKRNGAIPHPSEDGSNLAYFSCLQR